MTKTITKLHYNGVDYNIGGAWSLAEPTNLAVTTSGTTATITWTDPDDLRTIPPTAFSKSVLVRKVGSAPTSPSDWTVVVEETTRNQYKTTWYADTWLTSGTDYYYRVFTYATTWVASYGDSVKTVRERTFTITFTETSSPSWFSPTYSDDAAWLTAWSTDFDEFFGYSAVRLSTAWVETAEITQAQSGWNGKLDITQLWTLTSGDNVMIKFPVRWIKMSKNWSTVTLSITDAIWKESDWYQYYAFQKTWDIEANASATVATSPLYLWTYLSYTDTWNVLKSWSGKTPQWNYTMWNAISYAWANGTWYTISWWYQRQLINAYYMMKYGNPDCQSVIGRWFVDWNSAATATWWTNSQTNATYGESTWKYSVKLFGLEDWRWNQNQRVGWIFTDWSKNLYAAIHSFTANMSTSESQYKLVWQYAPWTSNPDISAIVWTNKGMFYPSATVNNSSYNTYWCDGGVVNASRFADAGGNWTNGSGAGAFYLAVYRTTSYTDAAIGARLMFL